MLNMVKRLTVYAKNLPELREKEKQIAKDLEDNILTDGAIKNLLLINCLKDICPLGAERIY